MKTRLALTLALLVVLPFGLLALLGIRVVSDERERVGRAFSDLLKEPLRSWHHSNSPRNRIPL